MIITYGLMQEGFSEECGGKCQQSMLSLIRQNILKNKKKEIVFQQM